MLIRQTGHRSGTPRIFWINFHMPAVAKGPLGRLEHKEVPMPIRTFILLVCVSAVFAMGFTSARASRHHHSVNISDGHKRPVTDCSDLRIRFDDEDALVRSEERTMTTAAAPVLPVRPHRNGGVQIFGWDKETYSVTACKAVARTAGEGLLSQITLAIENGKVTTNGPTGDED